MKREMPTEPILAIAARFGLSEPFQVEELTAGHINATYRLTRPEAAEAPGYILQRINTGVFRDPAALMDNIGQVTAHIRRAYQAEGIDPTRRVLHFLPADGGSLFYTDPVGGVWRAYRYIDNVTAYDRVDSPALFREVGRGFGDFQARLADFPAHRLAETIPDFHNTPRRYEAFCRAIREDMAGRVANVREEIAVLHDHRAMMGAIVSRLGADIPLRVTHNDTKLNNVLMDNETGRALCVIDLDTVMPGSALYDFGDAIRTGASTAAEDEPDTTRIDLNMTLFQAFTEGFVAAATAGLTPTEIRLLPLGATVLTCEQAMRFLTDYLMGDTYFKTRYPTHNLVRTRAQLCLLRRMEARMDEMNAVVKDLI